MNGNIITMNEKQLKAEAIAIKGDRILAVGTNKEIDKFKGEKTLVTDLNGKTVIPGIIDTHVHLWQHADKKYSGSSKKERLINAVRHYNSVGITTIHEPGSLNCPKETHLETYKPLVEEGKLSIRLYLAPYPEAIGSQKPFTGDFISMRGTKLRIDQGMESWRAILFEPYSDKSSTKGEQFTSQEKLEEQVRWAVKNGFQPQTHAIGDKGNRIVLDVYEKVLLENKGKDLRFRIEHAQLLHPDDIPRFGKLGVIPSMQPYHIITDKKWAEDRVGKERLKGGYAWRSLLNAGAKLAFSSDVPFADISPFIGMYAAVTRQDTSGKPEGGWYPAEKITIEEALRAYTIGAAYAAFDENVKGSIEAGKFADFVVVSDNPLEVDPPDLLKIKVLRTVLGGKTVYQTD
jgi:predicted amidohydrolase YtcJ